MDDAFSLLTAGLAVKPLATRGGVQYDKAKPQWPQSADSLPTRAIKTNDPFEAANILRKLHGIRVLGSKVTTPLDSFSDICSIYKLPKLVQANISACGFVAPTPVQIQAAPLLLDKRDVIAISPTGSGKTLAFLLPLVASIQHGASTSVQALVLCPTRELAAQTARSLERLAQGLHLHISLLTKAAAAGSDFSKVDALVTTPLRLCRLLKKKRIDLGQVRFLVLDETDKLLDMGFVEQIDAIMAACKHSKLVSGLFSATIPEKVEQLARTILKEPVRVTVGERNAAVSSVKQRLQFVGNEEGKLLALRQMLAAGLKPPVLVFVASKEKALALHRQLVYHNVHVDSIFSSQEYAQRSAAMTDFRAGKTCVLISTDVLARGIDFVGVQNVISFDFPSSTLDYIHRIGRTGRAGRSGEAITFFTEKDSSSVKPIVNIITAAGQEVPDWMHKMQVLPEPKKKKGKRKAADI